jgi:uncharacterized protein (TIGR02118 family)
MITVSVLYPNSDGLQFDMDYYLRKHMTLLSQRVGNALKGYTVDKGASGGAPGSKPPYYVILNMKFDSAEAFGKAFGPHAAEIMADIPKYTNAQPVIQISDPVVS